MRVRLATPVHLAAEIRQVPEDEERCVGERGGREGERKRKRASERDRENERERERERDEKGERVKT